MATSYPNEIWDGDSGNRSSDDAPSRSPDARDWSRLVAELAETQRQLDARAVNLGGKIIVSYVCANAGDVLILEPGDGKALQADSTGNARGTYAVDLQMDRALAANVALGNYSVIVGGSDNKTYNNYSAALSGLTNRSYGIYSIVCGGHNNYISTVPTHAFIGGGQLNEVTANHSGICCGYDNTVSGANSVISGGYENSINDTYSGICGGYQNTINGASYAFMGGGHTSTITGIGGVSLGAQVSTIAANHGAIIGSWTSTIEINSTYGVIIGGKNAKTQKYWGFASGGNVISKNFGEVARASGRFTVDGDAQTSLLTARKTTTDATQTTLKLDNASETIALDTDRSYVFCAHVVGHNDAGSQSAAYRIEGCIFCKGTTYTLKNTTTIIIYEDNAAWDSFAWVGGTPKSLHIYVEGVAATTINWMARIELTQVGK